MRADWAERLRRSTTGEDGTSVDDRKLVLQKMYEEIECELELLGVTAVEDRLQDDVPECIQFFLEAGMVPHVFVFCLVGLLCFKRPIFL